METWLATHHELALTGVGGQALLGHHLTAFFVSRQCPGVAIRAAMDWALQQASAKRAVVSGFHSPLELSVLKVLIAASSPAVVVLARPVKGAKLPPEWIGPLGRRHLAVVSNVAAATRLPTSATGWLCSLHTALWWPMLAQVVRWLRRSIVGGKWG